jgi:FixJ family two-component response regulator
MSYKSICSVRQTSEPIETPIVFSVAGGAPVRGTGSRPRMAAQDSSFGKGVPDTSATHESHLCSGGSASLGLEWPRSAKPPADTRAATPVVFIVNGDLHLRQLLHDLLSSEGFNATSFGSVGEYRTALDVPSCLILDVDLPDMSGFDLQRQVARTGAPIVFVTSRSDVPSCVRAIKEGAVDFLTTPFRDSDLLHAVHAAVAQCRDTRSQRTELARLQQNFALLTPREREVLTFVVSGLLNKQSACELGISEVTLQVHRSRIMQKMAAGSLAGLVRMATTLQIPLVCSHVLSARPNGKPKPAVSPRHMTVLELRNARRELSTSRVRSNSVVMTCSRQTQIPVCRSTRRLA